MTIKHLRDLIHQDFEAVNQLITSSIQSEVNLIDEVANHIIHSGGKRLRPMMVLLASHACNYQGSHHINLATSVEFLHTATLLHDDVIDESTLRRGRKTSNDIWGSKVSILVGDFLLTQYMQLLIQVGDLEIMKILTDIAYQIGCGEIKQLDNRNKTTITEAMYFDVIRCKTSLLFAASAKISAVLAGVDGATQEGLFKYGLHVGNAFQLIDDTLDYCADSETIGKNIGDDLADGITTLPLIHALQNGTPEQQQCIKTSLESGSLESLPEIQTAIKQTHAIEYTKQVAKDEVDKAISALQVLPNSVYKEALEDLARYALERNH